MATPWSGALPDDHKAQPPRRRLPGGDKSYDGSDSSLSAAADNDAFVVVVVSPLGNPRRRVYLSLSHATKALQRAQKRGAPASMVLCRLVPVAADLDGEVTT
jgi:hypothetical protein